MNNNKVRAVIFDWAGTTVDFGCMAPAKVFTEIFDELGIKLSIEDARAPMGMNKKDHIREILKNRKIEQQWNLKYNSAWNENDVNELYQSFIPKQLGILNKYSDLVPHTLDAQIELRMRKIKIGSTTGYNFEMIEIVRASAENQGFKPDSIICASDVPYGRPAPWMAFQVAMELDIYPVNSILKIGDTISDIYEGINAGMWSVGVIDSSNEMGLSFDEYKLLNEYELEDKRKYISKKYFDAGAHAVINSLSELPELIDKIENSLSHNFYPKLIE
ncbi:MAG: phosphonoacetaldehyde hydrolase [Ignavibacteriae bacterium]|nr:phosphonoacetaldehyde hydrolase [Ignavibacteriota bacterium]